MSNYGAPEIDWDGPMDEMSSFISSQGGIVIVTGFPTSACNTFLKLIRHRIKELKPGNLCVKFDPEDHTTRYEEGILAKLEQKLEIADSRAKREFLNDNDVGGDMAVTGVFVNEMPDPIRSQRRNLGRVDKIIKAIKARVQTNRIAFILASYHKMPEETISWFWNQLWEEGLEELVDTGLLVLCAYETQDAGFPDGNSLPRLDYEIRLPAQYDPVDRARVLQQVAEYIITRRQVTPEKAQVFAESWLSDWNYSPSRLHGALVVNTLRLKN
ncbi:MAG TPA: hypothetical protein VF779_14505 [Pyrinomonadaceae bacterium]